MPICDDERNQGRRGEGSKKNFIIFEERKPVEKSQTMKKILFLLVGVMMLSLSCSKSMDESIDCIIELMFTSFSHSAQPDTPLEVTYNLDYTGKFNVNIVWEFGDGTTEAGSGTSVTHIYPDAGNYLVKANITLSGDGYSSCSTSKEKHVDVGME